MRTFLDNQQMFKTLFVFLLVGSSMQQCTLGCLKCGSDSKCELCDASQLFYESQGTCLRSNITACELLAPDNTCERCQPGLAFQNATCASPPPASVIPNCKYYDASLACTVCQPTFIPRDNACVLPKFNISNCERQLNDTTCELCQQGYLLSSDRTGCMQVKASDNCKAYSFVGCNACASGFFRSMQAGTESMKSLVNSTRARNSFQAVAQFLSNYTVIDTFRSCLPATIEGCLDYINSTACAACSASYTLSAQALCVPKPQSAIANCVAYSSPSLCQNCSDSYYLSPTQTECLLAVGNLEGCAKFLSNSSQLVCVSCNATAFLQDGRCVNRTFTIANCQTLNPTGDNCLACSPNYALAPTATACVAAIQNCVAYNFALTVSNGTTTFAPECLACNNTFKLVLDQKTTQNACAAGAIANCLKFAGVASATASEVCVECRNGFFNSGNNTCAPQINITNCSAYSPTKLGVCDTCAPLNLPFVINSRCISAKLIPFCVAYATDGDCSTCESGYYLNNLECQKIPATFPFCTALSLNSLKAYQCTTCLANYILHNGVCTAPQAFITQNCDQYSAIDASNFVCNSCSSGYIDVPMLNTPLCYNLTLPNVDPAAATAVKANCRSHNGLVCIDCEDNYFVRADGTCATSASSPCPTTLIHEFKEQSTVLSTSTFYSFTRRNICFSPTTNAVTNCAGYNNIIQPNYSVGLSCYACLDSSVSVINLADQGFVYSSKSTSASPNPNSLFPAIIECPVASGITLFGAQSTGAATNVEYYMREVTSSSTVYGIAKCAMGFAGTAAASTNGNVYLLGCAAIDKCTTSTVYTGLNQNLNALFSCHACSIGVPAVHVVNTGSRAAPWYVQRVGKVSTECIASSLVQQFANCALFGYVYADQTSLLAPQLACLVCKGGYQLANGACVAFQNCDTSMLASHVNFCPACQPGFAYSFVQGKGIDFTNCVTASTLDKCDVVQQSSGSTGDVCYRCKSGYYLDKNGFCAIIQLANCQADIVTLPLSLAASDALALYYYAATSTNVAGCSKCAAGFSSFAFARTETVCLYSTAASAINKMQATNYIQGCVAYTSNKQAGSAYKILCTKCQSSNVLSQDRSTCFPNASLQNCQLASSETECVTCNPNYTPVNNQCVLQQITNCISYVEALNANSRNDLSCLQCKNGFYLSGIKNCYQGKVTNCNEYIPDQPTKCKNCAPGNLLVAGKTSDFCLPSPPNFNCTVFNVDDVAKNQITCTTCAPGNILSTNFTGFANTTCIGLNAVPNCAQYANQKIDSAQFDICSLCKPGFFLSRGECLALTPVPNCVANSTTEDKCLACATGYFLKDGNTCMKNPDGIPYCKDYSAQGQCSACTAPRYLVNNACVPVLKTIQNCDTYSFSNSTNTTVCDKCVTGYYPDSSKSVCLQARASNCDTFSPAGVCLNCPDKTYLTTAGTCDPITIQDCVSMSSTSNKCTRCISNSYPSMSTCNRVQSLIIGCLNYDSPNTCTECDRTYTLKFDRTDCISNKDFVDNACVNAVAQPVPQCAICSPNYYFDGNICKQCPPGCALCDTFQPKNCSLCMTNYFMDEKGVCNYVPPANTTSTVTDQPKVASAKLLFVALLTILAFIF